MTPFSFGIVGIALSTSLSDSENWPVSIMGKLYFSFREINSLHLHKLLIELFFLPLA
jgi:hypothetical protein